MVAQEIPLENSWEGLGILILAIPLLSFVISFLVNYRHTKNIARSVVGTFIGFIGAFFGLAIPINTETNLQYVINAGGAYAAIIYFVVMTTAIGFIVIVLVPSSKK